MNDQSWMTLTNLSLLFGWLAVYFCLPKRISGSSRLIGYGAGCIALIISAIQIFTTYSFNPELVLFCIFSFFAVVGSCLMIVAQNPAHGAICFALTITSTGGIFLLLAAPFVMAANIIVYAGAIIVTFLFLLMLVNQHNADLSDSESREPFLASVTGFILMGSLISILTASFSSQSSAGNRNEIELIVNETQQALSITNLSELKAKVINGDNYVVTKLKNALGGSGIWVERIEVDVQKNGTLMINKSDDIVEIKAALTSLVSIGTEYLKYRSLLRPSVAMVGNSGADPSLPLGKIRKDQSGRPAMPADNTTFLGKLLFSDQLIAVELAGLLLLVATIGAIVIVRQLPTKVSS
ncbi:MAG: NADH-quinone oxidoreductase subunit J [Planctomycetota bacterium]